MNRREALRTLAAGGATGALAAGAIVATVPAEATTPDPLLDLVSLYRATVNTLEASGIEDDDAFEAEYDRIVEPLWHRLRDETPIATTEAGALAAIRLANEEMRHTADGFAPPLVAAAVAYFDGRA